MILCLLTYDEWLALSDPERENVKLHQWNAYARDGVAIVFMGCDTASIAVAIQGFGYQCWDLSRRRVFVACDCRRHRL